MKKLTTTIEVIDKKYHCDFNEAFKGATHGTYKLRYSIQRQIPLILKSGSNYYFHLIVKYLGKKFEDN